MVQVTVRVRPKNGYTYPNKIKTVTLESSCRLENLLQRHAASSASASSHAALYLNGRELPLNSSIASHNLDDGVVIESCKSPAVSAAISAVLRDLERIKTTTQEAERTKDVLVNMLQVPVRLLDDDDDDDDNAIFWQTNKWGNESLKTRTICLATMKKILQRDDRYAIHDLPSVTDNESLYRHIQPVWEHQNTTNAGRGRRWNNIGNLFTSSTKNGKPSTIWVLLEHKLNLQIQIAADFSPRSSTSEDNGSSIDALEEFIRLDTLRHNSASDESATRTANSSSSNSSSQRRNQSNSSRAAASTTTTPSTRGTVSNLQSPSRRQPRRRQYCPEYASGPFAVLCALREAMEGNHKDSNGRRQLSLTENQLKRLAQPRCRSNFYDRQMMIGSRNAFACMEGLAERNLVRKEIIMDNVEKWALLLDGEALAKECLNFERAVNDVIPSYVASSTNMGHQRPVNGVGDEILLVVDSREDAHFRERIEMQGQDEHIPTEERELPAGDYLFLQRDSVIPVVIERKSWSDLADSVLAKGRAHQRLDCVKLGTNAPSCERQNCQLCKMKRTGCTQIMFIIEGARCRGRDGYRNNKCSPEKRCQACKALVDRHGSSVTQEKLEKVLHRLQVEHGCHVHFTRSYNETISSLFIMRSLLQEGKSFASMLLSESRALGEVTSSGDADLDRAIALSLAADNTPSKFTYDQFCSNARSSKAPRRKMRRQNGDVLEWKVESLASMIVSEGPSWRQSLGKELVGLVSANRDGNSRKRPAESSTCTAKEKNPPKRQRIEDDGDNRTICLDSDSENSILEAGRRQEVIELNDSRESLHQLENDPEDSSVDLIGSDTSEQHDDIIELEDSQDSVQVLDIHDFGGLHASARVMDTAKGNDSHIDVPASGEEQAAINYKGTIESCPLLIVHGWDDYDDKYCTNLNRLWQESYNDHHSSVDVNAVNSTESSKLYENAVQSLRQMVNDDTQFPYLRRKTFISALLWIQLKLGVMVRTVPRNEFADDMKQLWTTRSIDSQSFASRGLSVNSPTSTPIARRQLPPPQSRAGNKRSATSTVTALKQTSSSSTKQSTAARKLPYPSPTRALAIEARLRRFENLDSNNKDQGITTSQSMNAISNIAAHRPAYVPSSTSARRTEKQKWKCCCTLDNDIDALECAACENPNPNLADTNHQVASAAASLSAHAYNYRKQASSPRSLFTDDAAQSSYQGDFAIPARTSSTVPPKKSVRCGACGLAGHNRGTATAQTCPDYNDEKEAARREEKWRKTQEKAIVAEQEYEGFQLEQQHRQTRQAELARQMDEMKKDMERTTQYSAAEEDRRRKKAESARRRAARQR